VFEKVYAKIRKYFNETSGEKNIFKEIFLFFLIDFV